jgi:uroporphyrinogen decarboxylase
MTSHERIRRMFAHEEADRIPVFDNPWRETIQRWRKEGLPEGTPLHEFFGLDRYRLFGINNSPRYPEETVEETEEYRIYTTRWGATMKQLKDGTTSPEHISHTIVDADSWEEAKKRMTPDRDRIDWEKMKHKFEVWRGEGAFIAPNAGFGFDASHSGIVGTETLLMEIADDPDWLVDMWNHQLTVTLEILDMMWEEGLTFDAFRWPDDMGYKENQFFSVDTYVELLKPVHRRAIDWAHAKGIPAHLHSCGDIRPFVPHLVELGLDALNPLEVKAGMDPVALKAEYGDRLVLHGGLNAALYHDVDAMCAEVERIVPTLKEGGGYIFSSDHTVPSNVSLEDFRRVIETAKRAGSYN